MAERGHWATTMDGDRVWCCAPDREHCGGAGYMTCRCGGDQCYCGNQGEIECMGCEYCDQIDDDFDYEDEP